MPPSTTAQLSRIVESVGIVVMPLLSGSMSVLTDATSAATFAAEPASTT